MCSSGKLPEFTFCISIKPSAFISHQLVLISASVSPVLQWPYFDSITRVKFLSLILMGQKKKMQVFLINI